MTREDLERRLEAAEKQNLGLLDEIKNLKTQLADMQDEPEIPDFPEFTVGDDYYPHIRWESTPRKHTVDCLHKENCKKPLTAEMNYFHFHSAEYYHSFESRCKLIAMMLHCKWYLDRDYVPDWNNNTENKFCVIFKRIEHKFDVDVWQLVDHNVVCFSTEENAQKCADWLNTHWKEDGHE